MSSGTTKARRNKRRARKKARRGKYGASPFDSELVSVSTSGVHITYDGLVFLLYSAGTLIRVAFAGLKRRFLGLLSALRDDQRSSNESQSVCDV